ncbi:hypothetical protein CPB84DRAFT_1828973 [Gymnopilus junonius]|uniref:Uncharacterized protein n=1 Tax=Gymnopilus junonius TaxID=109634 RepID=A0A9P5TH04_GYMJU|nr:hypothetical protein CPB84DRAFT_1828973 [Gymnopilus junonius]
MAQPPMPNDFQAQAPQHPGGAPPFVQNMYPQGNYYPYPPGGLYPQQYPPPPMPGVPQYMQPHGYHAPPLAYPPQLPVAQLHAPPPAPRKAVQARPPPVRQRPNEEPRPGVFRFQVDVVEGNAKREFTAETDMPWEDFRCLVVGLLENMSIELAYKIPGEPGKASLLKTRPDYEAAMSRVCQKALSARSKPVSIEIKNIAKALPSKKAAKRKREDDIPPEHSEELDTQLGAYKQLEAILRCELHHGHCFVDRTNGMDNHRRLSHAEMTLWAKKMSLNEASKYSPPHCLSFDRPPTKKPRRSLSSSNVPEVHVTIQNITSEGESIVIPGSAPVSARISSGSSMTLHITPAIPDFGFIPPAFPPPEILTPPNAPSTLPPPNAPLTMTPSPEHPSTSSSHSNGDVFLSSTPAEADSLFPPMATVIQQLAEDRPGAGFENLEQVLAEAGITSSHQILLLPENVLCVAANLKASQARTLRNHTRRIILPLLGLNGNYDEPEIEDVEVRDNNVTTTYFLRPNRIADSSSNEGSDNDAEGDDAEGDDAESDDAEGDDVEGDYAEDDDAEGENDIWQISG